MSEFVDTRVAHATELLKEYLEAGEQDTALLRDLGWVFGQLRGVHQNRYGKTDWGGRSGGYRACLDQVYTDAGVTDQDRRHKIQEKVRYHIHAWLRQTAPVDELKEAGVGLESRSQRWYRKRQDDPVRHVVQFGELVDETYTPEGREQWWTAFATANAEARRRMVVGVYGSADGVFS